ncbi:DNA-formamidopyrimidine glycosylase family protein [Cellulomonas bogoriensis]|uniref:DNA-(apurinic or apyrimidinic site) lyase n=1 Tax=Cellulomonas bogoriensis 69B4 = DSM 16987 TaxID=1386082 RepID=A0A0A0BL69_9CELL|nr:DNA-formamidopyrimidine glycosylase family protein [Cellulomonas bogoriensis]KGM08706.1 DNA glycosylase [Cellulomonas bogoriensis 69B4 = DSM 16987]
MPEGDILHRAARTLTSVLVGHELTTGELRWGDLGGTDLTGTVVTAVVPVGKHLLTRLEDGRTLHTHLRMEGSWIIQPAGSAPARRLTRDPHVRAVLGTSRHTTFGHRLGMLDLITTADEATVVGHLGPDVLAADFPGAGLAQALAAFERHGDRPIGEALLDQRLVAGIGTIYMAESLFLRQTYPWAVVADVDVPSILMTARHLMARSVAAPTPTATGSSVRGTQSRVHSRAGKPCTRCGSPVAVAPVGRPPRERPAFHCPVCQTAGRER